MELIMACIRNGKTLNLKDTDGHPLSVERVSPDCYRVIYKKQFKHKRKFLTFEGVRNLLVRQLPAEAKGTEQAVL